MVAREKGIIPWEWIVDETRQEERASSWNGLGDFGETVVRGYRKDFWQHQKSWIKVYSEKGTVGGIVRPMSWTSSRSALKSFTGSDRRRQLHDVAEESLDRRTAVSSKFSTLAISIRPECICPRSICRAASKNMAALSI